MATAITIRMSNMSSTQQKEFQQLFEVLLLVLNTKKQRNILKGRKSIADHCWRSAVLLMIFQEYITSNHAKKNFEKAFLQILLYGLEEIDELEQAMILGQRICDFPQTFNSQEIHCKIAQLFIYCERYLCMLEHFEDSSEIRDHINALINELELPKELLQFTNELLVKTSIILIHQDYMSFKPESHEILVKEEYYELSDSEKILYWVSKTGRQLSRTIRFEGQPYWNQIEYEYKNVAEHSYVTAICFIFMYEKLPQKFLKQEIFQIFLGLFLIHDIEETGMGDWPPLVENGHAHCQKKRAQKDEIEKQTGLKLFALLPIQVGAPFFKLWDLPSEDAEVKHIVKAIDTIEATVMIWEMTQGVMTPEHLEASVRYSLKRVSQAPSILKDFMTFLCHHQTEHHIILLI